MSELISTKEAKANIAMSVLKQISELLNPYYRQDVIKFQAESAIYVLKESKLFTKAEIQCIENLYREFTSEPK